MYEAKINHKCGVSSQGVLKASKVGYEVSRRGQKNIVHGLKYSFTGREMNMTVVSSIY